MTTTAYYLTVPYVAHTTVCVERPVGLNKAQLIDSIKPEDLVGVEGPTYEAVLEMALDTLEKEPAEVTVECD